MILNLFRKNRHTGPVLAVYTSIVAQSRHPSFYADWGVPDTVTGRFDMIGVHLTLLFRRLRGAAPATQDFSQQLYDLFFSDMDRSLREMGVGDLGVPKRIKKMTTVFHGLMGALSGALDKHDRAEIEAVLRRNVYAGAEQASASALTDYVIAKADALSRVPVDQIVAGRLELEAAA